jgi:hypothetical protein
MNSVDIKPAFSHFASDYHNVKLHVQSHAWRDVSFC